MNDLPAVVAWLVAVPVAALVALVWLLARRVPRPAERRWRRRAVGWAVAAAVLGPPAFGLIASVVGTVARWRESLADPAQALGLLVGSFVMMTMWHLFVSVAFLLLPYLPLLLLWARLGPRLGRLETTRAGVAAGAVLLAVPGAAAPAIAYGSLDPPFGYQGAELATFGLLVLAGIAVGVLVPRLVVPALRPGVFAGGVDGAADEA